MTNPNTPQSTPTSETPNQVNPSTPKENKEKNELDELFIPIYGKHPSQEDALRILKERSTAFKDCTTYEEASKLLEKNNPDLFNWLSNKNTKNDKEKWKEEKKLEEIEKKVYNQKWLDDDKNNDEIDKYLKESRWYLPEDKNVGTSTAAAQAEREAKEAEAKKKQADKIKKENEKKIEEKKKELLTPPPTIIPSSELLQKNSHQTSLSPKPEPSKTIIWSPQEKSSEIPPPPKEATQPQPKIEKTKKEKKVRNWSLNPFKALKHVGKKGLEILSMPLHIASKAATTISRPQDIFKRQYWKDIGTNIGKWAKSIAKTFTGLVYTKHREDTEYVNTNQAYGKTQWPSGINKPEAAITSFGRTLGKLPKAASHIVAGTTSALANTLDNIRTGKTDFSDTQGEFIKAGSRDKRSK